MNLEGIAQWWWELGREIRALGYVSKEFKSDSHAVAFIIQSCEIHLIDGLLENLYIRIDQSDKEILKTTKLAV